MKKPGLVGNFDANLSLYVFFLLGPLFFINGGIQRALLKNDGSGTFIRIFSISMILIGCFTILNGAIISTHAYNVTTFGMDIFRKALITSPVPIFITILFIVSFIVAQNLPASQFQKMIMVSFYVVAGYTIIQASSLVVPNTFYNALWPVFEGARDNNGISYVARFHRLNGTTQEPAEMAKLLCLYFLPWLVYPAHGKRRTWATIVALSLTAMSLSIIGFALILLALPLIMLSQGAGTRFRLALLLAVYVGVLAIIAFGDPFWHRIVFRLGNAGDDPSTIIRSTYDLAALDIIREHFWFGVGWSNELFLFPEKIKGISNLWEVQRDMMNANALTAKSLLLRLAMYSGVPIFVLLVVTAVKTYVFPIVHVKDNNKSRARFFILLYAVGATMDGGIITSFFMWTALAFNLAYLTEPREYTSFSSPASVAPDLRSALS